MSRMRRCCATPFLVALALVTSACSSSAPPISIAVSPSSSQSIDQGQTLGITATVTNQTRAEGVAWSLVGPGILSSPTATSVTYNPPVGAITSGQQATVTATSCGLPPGSVARTEMVGKSTWKPTARRSLSTVARLRFNGVCTTGPFSQDLRWRAQCRMD